MTKRERREMRVEEAEEAPVALLDERRRRRVRADDAEAADLALGEHLPELGVALRGTGPCAASAERMAAALSTSGANAQR
jgi:hypothetical protein